ncbi:MAG: polysaccharide deacetylase family protein [Kordiimonadales bacterium]|nr:MAG: polysaccharide deacetylase family protein [Kordiimonadales bacterium]
MASNKPIGKTEVAIADISLVKQSSSLAFTVDLEEWFQVGAFENVFDRGEWQSLESRVEIQISLILPLLAEMGVKATFFCLGWVAERFPKLILEIAEAGHEIGCHGMDHRRLFTMSQSDFANDVRQAKRLLEDASGKKVQGYRAPSFSLTSTTQWVYPELAVTGFSYSSSVYPVQTDHYGSKNAPRTPYFPAGNHGVLEIPLTVCDVPFKRLPASGGGYFRLMPYMLGRYLLQKASNQTSGPSVFYMHPWEVDTGQPYVKEASRLSRFRHYVGQKALPDKLRALGRDFDCQRMDKIYAPLFSGKGA